MSNIHTTWTPLAASPSFTALPAGVAPAIGGDGRGRQAWFEAVVAQIDRVSQLPAGWDSNAADPIDPKLAEDARALALSLAAAGVSLKPHVNPTPAGGVQFEWESGSRYLEVEIVGAGRATFYYHDLSSKTIREGELSEGGLLNELLQLIDLASSGQR